MVAATDGARALTKNQKRRLKKKEKKKQSQENGDLKPAEEVADNAPTESESEVDVEVEYVAPALTDEEDPAFAEFRKVFERFNATEEEEAGAREKADTEKQETKEKKEGDEEDEEKNNRLSRRQRKKQNRLSVAELKQLVQRPDVVEAHDVTSSDPRLLVHLKAYRNTVEVPRHWCHKRKYLQGKRGIEKPAFKLPDFIEATGIGKLRGTDQEEDEKKGIKRRLRERMQPKMGRIDIDYQLLHDAFFRFQTKPKMTIIGDLYYEGKEFETRMVDKKPGVLSGELRNALGMGPTSPPPWLINMQRYGPPPSYPNLKIPGLNAPIPPGASFGYHVGGWGKPPVDEAGRPLYGDVFTNTDDGVKVEPEPVDKTIWGELLEEEEEEEEEEAAAAAEEEEEDTHTVDMSGMVTPSEDGMESVTSGLETPQALDLRKARMQNGMETPEHPPELFKVLEQKDISVGGSIYGSSHGYVLPGKGKPKGADGVQVSIDAAELENMDEDTIKQKYEESLEAQKSNKEDISDLLEEQEKKRKRKLKAQESKNKKYKDFKF